MVLRAQLRNRAQLRCCLFVVQLFPSPILPFSGLLKNGSIGKTAVNRVERQYFYIWRDSKKFTIPEFLKTFLGFVSFGQYTAFRVNIMKQAIFI